MLEEIKKNKIACSALKTEREREKKESRGYNVSQFVTF